ncbi:MAG: methyltransferase domain-containing protein [Flavobacteriales bacterium]|nr:methyltransferase domain-containing protein [Flavobacteriales bacterium]
MSLLTRFIPLSWKIRLRNRFLRGDLVQCPICGGRFLTFLPAGVVPRANAICPGCGSMERTRAYWLYLNSIDRSGPQRIRLLHVAPEKALFHRFRNDARIDYVPVDKFEPGYTYPQGTRDMDITALDLPDDAFDRIICSHVLEHVLDDRKAMAELFRVLKPGGWGIIQVPLDLARQVTYEDPSIVDPREREAAFGQFDHVRIYGRDYEERLKEAGFRVERVPFAQGFDQAERFRYGLVMEDLFIAHKPA